MMNRRHISTLCLSGSIPKQDGLGGSFGGGLDETRLLGGLGRLRLDTVERVLQDWR